MTAEIEPLLSLEEVASNLDIALYGPGETLLDESHHLGNTEEVWEFVVEEAGDYAVRIFAATPDARAHYTLHVDVLPPVPGIDLVPSDVEAIPGSLYPGGLMNVAWSDSNMGDTAAGAYNVKVWLSKDQALQPEEDIAVAQLPTSGTPPASSVDHLVQFLLPSDILGGDWYLLAHIDPDGVLDEVDATNNVAASDVLFLDAQLTCADDDYEPNDAPVIATPLDLSTGNVSIAHMVVCPQLPDWYAIDLEEGEALVATATYAHDEAKGLVSIELWDPTANAMLWTNTGLGWSTIQLPWVWSSGTYLLKVSTQSDGGLETPYSYNLSVAAPNGLEANRCDGDVFEDNSWPGAAATIGCGLQVASLCQGDIDHYDIIVKGGDTLTITLQHAEAGLKMTLYADQGSEPVDQYAGNGQVAYYAPQETPLLLVVEPDGDPSLLSSYDYSLFMDGVSGRDLIVEDVVVYPMTIDQGEDGVLDYTVSNTCIDDAPPFDVTIWLSLDGSLDATDVDVKTLAVPGV
ncbi:MAG: CARDB domain-containing protein, partial [Myxococcota bacterium]|nr:CARDB domain-containing protein [Myxococcota bacterium]